MQSPPRALPLTLTAHWQLACRHIAQFYGLVKLPKGVVVGSADMRKRPGPLWAILLELSDGGSLYDLIGQQMANPHTTLYTDNQALAWCLQLASALEHLHSRETMVIHRDVKPSNVLLKLDPHNKSKLVVKLVDFGLHVVS